MGTKEAWEAFLETHGKVKGNFYVNLAVASLQKLQSPKLPEAEVAAEDPSSASTNKEQLAPKIEKKSRAEHPEKLDTTQERKSTDSKVKATKGCQVYGLN